MTKEEILKRRKKSIYILKNTFTTGIVDGLYPLDRDLFDKHCQKYDFIHGVKSPKIMGQYFLYESLLDGRYRSNIPHDIELTYPKLGIYLNSLPCDQTIEVEWVDYRRTWEWRIEYEYQHESKTYENYMAEIPTEIQRMPLWSESLLVYGVWDSKPNWKQLKQAYERTWWFHRTIDELRDIQLDRLLK